MSKVTSKLQVTVPKAIADAYDIAPGTSLAWLPAGDSLRVVVEGARSKSDLDVAERLRLFDEGSRRQAARQRVRRPAARTRGWTREELYTRGRSR